MRTAVIGIGSNSLRMLLADVCSNELHRLKRYRKGLRVFAALDNAGNITSSMIQTACDSVKELQEAANEGDAEAVHLFATSAVRDAKNQEIFIQALEKTTGLTLEICSGECEAMLSFIGASNGGAGGVIDIGGGSTELVLGNETNIDHSISLQMGAVRLARKINIDDIPSAWQAVSLAKEVLMPYQKQFASSGINNWTGVGGTFTTMAALIQRTPWDLRDRIHGFVFTKDDAITAMEYLAPIAMSERLAMPYLQPQRADIIVHGIAILIACMMELHIDSIAVSEYGNLEGYLKMKYFQQSAH